MFLRLAGVSVPACLLLESIWIEPAWINLTHLQLSESPTRRIVHFSDLHYKGNRSFLTRVMERINASSPDLVCFTGDIVEDSAFLQEALDILSAVQKPMYGVPGNHDYWSGAPFPAIADCFASTGGAWLVDRKVALDEGAIRIEGRSGQEQTAHPAGQKGPPMEDDGRGKEPGDMQSKSLLLCHYPAIVKNLERDSHDLILAGHSHGGQVRLPLMGAPMLPYGVGEYEKGFYPTPAGPLYVNVGIGTYLLPVRFLCRPEITLVDL